MEQGRKQRHRRDDHGDRQPLHHQGEQDLGQFPWVQQFQCDAWRNAADAEKDQQEHKGEFDPHFPDGLGEQTIGHAACPEHPGIAGHGKDHAEYHQGGKDHAFQFCFWHMQLSSFSAKKRNDTKYSETIRHGSQRYLMSFLLCGYSVIIIPRFFKFVKGESN